jgi:hypothetical protein
MSRTTETGGDTDRTTRERPVNESERGQRLDAAGAESVPPPAPSAPPPPPPPSGAKPAD